MSLLLPLCSGCALPWHKCELVAIPVVTPCFVFLHSSLPSSPTLGSWISCPRQQTKSRVALGKKGEHSWMWERGGKIAALGSKKLLCQLANLTKAPSKFILTIGSWKKLRHLSVLEPLLPNPGWLRAKLIYTAQVISCNLCSRAAGEDSVVFASSRWGGDLWALLVAAPVPIDCWSGRDSAGTCLHTSPRKWFSLCICDLIPDWIFCAFFFCLCESLREGTILVGTAVVPFCWRCTVTGEDCSVS